MAIRSCRSHVHCGEGGGGAAAPLLLNGWPTETERRRRRRREDAADMKGRAGALPVSANNQSGVFLLCELRAVPGAELARSIWHCSFNHGRFRAAVHIGRRASSARHNKSSDILFCLWPHNKLGFLTLIGRLRDAPYHQIPALDVLKHWGALSAAENAF